MRALLVEPDPRTQTLLCESLEARGWRVTRARGRAEAEELFARAPFPLLVVGARLDDGDPLELCRSIRTSAAGRAAFLVALPAEPTPAAIAALAELGVDDYLVPPLSRADVDGRFAFAEAHLFANPSAPEEGNGAVLYQARIIELEERLKVERASLEELFESAPEGIAIVDSEDRVVRLNGEFTRMFGYTAQEAHGRPINELIVPPHLREEGLEVTRGVTDGRRLALETVRMNKDGRLIDVSLLATPIQVGDGPIGAFALYRDIGKRRAQEAALRESEQRYRALFDQSPVGVFLCDRDFRIIHCNERLTRIVRTPYGRIIGFSLFDLIDHRVLPAIRQALAGEPATYEGPYRATTSGTKLWISAHMSPLRDDAGKVVGGIAVLEDITERQESNQQLRAQAAELERVNAALRERTLELEEAMQARSRLYTALNHELRTPISAIMLYQELLMTGALGPLPPDHMQAIEHSHTAARHLLDLVRDVLDLSRLEAGKVWLQPAEFSLPELLQDLVNTTHALAQRHGSELVLEPGPEPALLRSDAQRVRQILLNFLSNAAKYGRGGPIHIRYSLPDEETAVVEVSDEGIGIAAEDLSRVFEDFYQVGRGPDGGTGLGLAICCRLADLLNGRLEVESELGVGSTFRLLLPRILPETHAPVAMPD